MQPIHTDVKYGVEMVGVSGRCEGRCRDGRPEGMRIVPLRNLGVELGVVVKFHISETAGLPQPPQVMPLLGGISS